jgi:hypothetical protein
MRAFIVIIADVLGKKSLQMVLVQRDRVQRIGLDHCYERPGLEELFAD